MTGPKLTIIALVALLASPAQAADEALNCFGRSYSPEHLAANPGQQVRMIEARAMWMSGYTGPKRITGYEIRVQFRDDPRAFSASAACWPRADGRLDCASDCDSGSFVPEIGADGRLRLHVGYLMAETDELLPGERISNGCMQSLTRDISDKGPGNTTFMLYPRDLRECRW
ncbi:MAG: hypothetical protein Q4G25_04730 [Paracoccus sp. (in: a-proteobacteria)]|nr:hypothetical protein [Paracoccus sp. (in: a-proteobacteria)]